MFSNRIPPFTSVAGLLRFARNDMVNDLAKRGAAETKQSQRPGDPWARAGFSLAEVLIAAFFLAVILAGLLGFIGQSQRSSMTAHYELLAYEIAREPIAVFRDFGYEWVTRQYLEGGPPLAAYPKGPVELSSLDPLGLKYPGEATAFLREILVEPSPTGSALRVTVRVTPRTNSHAAAWWQGKRSLELRALILKEEKQ